MRTVTLRDVASKAGVSLSTASRALNTRRDVSAATQRAVFEAVQALGYRTNSAARSLRTSRTMTIGAVFANLRSPVVFDAVEGLTLSTEERDYTVMVTSAHGDLDRYRLLVRRLSESRVDALVLASPPDPLKDEVDALHALGLPTLALFSRGAELKNTPLVTASEDRAVDAAVARLAEQGHSVVTYLEYHLAHQSRRPTSIAAAAKRHRVEVVRALLPPNEAPADVTAALRSSLTPNGNATAVIASYRQVPVVLDSLRELGLRVRDDVSLVTFCDSAILAQPDLASIHVDVIALGRAAGAVAVDWIEGQLPSDVLDLDHLAAWSDGDSLGRAPQASS